MVVTLVTRMALTSSRKMKKKSRNCKGKRGKERDKALRLKLEPIHIDGS